MTSKRKSYVGRLVDDRQYNPFHPHCGPFNRVSDEPSDTKTDEECRIHDMKYAEYQSKGAGYSPYYKFSDADEKLANSGSVYSPFFKLKRIMAPRLESKYEEGSLQKSALNSEGGKDLHRNPKQDKGTYMPYRYKNRRNLWNRRRSRRGVRRQIALHKDDSALQKIEKMDSGVLASTAYNEAVFKTIEFNSVADLLQMSDDGAYGPYLMRSQLSGGAYAANGVMDYAQVDLQYANVQKEGVSTTTSNVGLNFQGGMCKIRFRNNDLVDADIDIMLYKCVCSTSTSVVSYIESNFDQKRHATSGDLNVTPYYNYSTLDPSPEWKKVGRMVSIRLKPTEESTYTFRFPKKRIKGRDIYVANAAGFNKYNGITQALVMRIRGAITHDSTDPTLVGLGVVQVDYVTQEWLQWRHTMPPLLSGLFFDGNLDAVVAGRQAHEDVEHND